MTQVEGIDPYANPSSVNSLLAPGNSLTPLPNSDTPQPTGMFLAPPSRHDTRSPPPGVNLAEWFVEETAPQVNRISLNWSLHNPTLIARGNRGNDIIARPGLENSVNQLYIARTDQNNATDPELSIEAQRSSRWGSFREWARRAGGINRRRDNIQRQEQQHRYASRQTDLSLGRGQASQQDPTQRRQSLVESLRALRRQPFPLRRQNSQPESYSHQAQAGLESSQSSVNIPRAPNNNPRAVTVGGSITEPRDHQSSSSSRRPNPTNKAPRHYTSAVETTGFFLNVGKEKE